MGEVKSCDNLKIAQLVGEVLEFKCLNQIFAITVLSRKEAEKSIVVGPV